MSHLTQMNNPLYKNWLLTVLGLTYVKEGIEDFIKHEVKVCHTKLINDVCIDLGVPSIDCTAQNYYPFPLKSLPKGNCGTHPTFRPASCSKTCPNYISCRLYKNITHLHRFGINCCSYKNTNASLWTSTPWELAKCFLTMDGYSTCIGPQDTDCTGLLSIIINMKAVGDKINLNIDGKTDIVSAVSFKKKLYMTNYFFETEYFLTMFVN